MSLMESIVGFIGKTLGSLPMEYQLPLIVAFVIGFPVLMMTITNRLYAQYRVANMAQRMGLTIAEGNPKLNMVNAIPIHNLKMEAGVGGSWLSRAINTTKETKVRLIGAPHGRPIEFVYFRRHEIKEGLLMVTTDSCSNAGSACRCRSPFPRSRSCGAVQPYGLPGFTGLRRDPNFHCRRSPSANRISTANWC